MKAIFTGTIKDGKLLMDHRAEMQNHLHSLEGRRIEVTVDKVKHNRSHNQNAYYHGVVCKLIADHTGAEPEEVHTALKYQFAEKRFVGNLVAPASTKRLDTIAFEHYLDKVRRWAQEELGVHIPLPNEVEV